MFENYRQLFVECGSSILPLADAGTESGRLPRVRDRFLRAVTEEIRAALPPQADEPVLSERERAVLRLLADGMSNKAIARALQVSDNTVKFHLKNIFSKLGVSSRAEAASALATYPLKTRATTHATR